MTLKEQLRQNLTGHLSDEKTEVDVNIAEQIAEDFANCSGKTFNWLIKNANRFGWYIGTGDPSKPGFESWHWEYVLGNVNYGVLDQNVLSY